MNISVKEYAKKVGRSEIIIRQQCREDKLICCKRGRDWFIDEEQEYPFWSKSEKYVHHVIKSYIEMINLANTDKQKEINKNKLSGALSFAYSMRLIKKSSCDYYIDKFIK